MVPTGTTWSVPSTRTRMHTLSTDRPRNTAPRTFAGSGPGFALLIAVKVSAPSSVNCEASVFTAGLVTLSRNCGKNSR